MGEREIEETEDEQKFTVEFTILLDIKASSPEEARERAWRYLEGLEEPLQAINNTEVT